MAIDWTEELTSRLGTLPDTQLAREIGCSHGVVMKKRHELGIQACLGTRRTDWTEYDELLGTMTDKELAKVIGCSFNTVFRRRKKLGTKSFRNTGPDEVDWAANWDRLGVEDDEDLAKDLDCPVSSVAKKRREKGVLKSAGSVEDREWFDLLGTMTDKELGEQAGVSRQRIHQLRERYEIESHQKQSAPVVDMDVVESMVHDGQSNKIIVEATSISASGLAQVRRDLGVPATKTRPLPQVIVEHQSELGAITDSKFGKLYSMNQQTVCYYRNRLGISPCNPKIDIDMDVARGVISVAESKGHPNSWVAKQLGCSTNYVTVLKKKVAGV